MSRREFEREKKERKEKERAFRIQNFESNILKDKLGFLETLIIYANARF